mmetsp:Transcript_3492/g.5899  ORF Transcript_3492/g.5899 Transcript_3492/m.5899 type:complete len:397 (+) Transcript_3492:537-1727(+)
MLIPLVECKLPQGVKNEAGLGNVCQALKEITHDQVRCKAFEHVLVRIHFLLLCSKLLPLQLVLLFVTPTHFPSRFLEEDRVVVREKLLKHLLDILLVRAREERSEMLVSLLQLSRGALLPFISFFFSMRLKHRSDVPLLLHNAVALPTLHGRPCRGHLQSSTCTPVPISTPICISSPRRSSPVRRRRMHFPIWMEIHDASHFLSTCCAFLQLASSTHRRGRRPCHRLLSACTCGKEFFRLQHPQQLVLCLRGSKRLVLHIPVVVDHVVLPALRVVVSNLPFEPLFRTVPKDLNLVAHKLHVIEVLLRWPLERMCACVPLEELLRWYVPAVSETNDGVLLLPDRIGKRPPLVLQLLTRVLVNVTQRLCDDVHHLALASHLPALVARKLVVSQVLKVR